jgi:hypothetical protein
MSQQGAVPIGGNILLPTARVLIDRLDAAGARTGMRFVGEASDFTLTPNDETVKIYSHVSPARELLAQNTIRRGGDFSMELREFTQENLALALSGTELSATQTPGGSFGSGAGDPVGGAATICKGGRWYAVSKLGIAVSPAPVMKHTTIGGTVVPTTDYYVDYASGLVYIVAGGAADNKLLWLEYTYGVVTQKIVSGADTTVKAYLHLIEEPANGPALHVEIWSSILTAGGDLKLIGDDYAAMTVKGSMLSDAANPLHTTTPFFKVWY